MGVCILTFCKQMMINVCYCSEIVIIHVTILLLSYLATFATNSIYTYL